MFCFFGKGKEACIVEKGGREEESLDGSGVGGYQISIWQVLAWWERGYSCYVVEEWICYVLEEKGLDIGESVVAET